LGGGRKVDFGEWGLGDEEMLIISVYG